MSGTIACFVAFSMHTFMLAFRCLFFGCYFSACKVTCTVHQCCGSSLLPWLFQHSGEELHSGKARAPSALLVCTVRFAETITDLLQGVSSQCLVIRLLSSLQLLCWNSQTQLSKTLGKQHLKHLALEETEETRIATQICACPCVPASPHLVLQGFPPTSHSTLNPGCCQNPVECQHLCACCQAREAAPNQVAEASHSGEEAVAEANGAAASREAACTPAR